MIPTKKKVFTLQRLMALTIIYHDLSMVFVVGVWQRWYCRFLLNDPYCQPFGLKIVWELKLLPNSLIEGSTQCEKTRTNISIQKNFAIQRMLHAAFFLLNTRKWVRFRWRDWPNTHIKRLRFYEILHLLKNTLHPIETSALSGTAKNNDFCPKKYN